MNVLVLNGSPSGNNSITLQTVLFIEKYFKSCEFHILHVGQRIRSYEKDFSEAAAALGKADLILFCYPVYTFLVPSQLHRFVELMKNSGIDLSGKYAAQITTSKHFYDMTAHQFIQENCLDLGLVFIDGFSADMDDLLHKKGQREALEFFRFVCWNLKEDKKSILKRKSGKVVIVADYPSCSGDVHEEDGKVAENSHLERLISRFISKLPYDSSVVNIRDFQFAGGCLGCFHCASDGTCVYKDGFDDFLRMNIQASDAIVYAYTVKDHSMGSRFKMFDDRQFCNGHRTVTMGKPVGYLVSGNLDKENNLKTLMAARAQVGGNYLAGIATNEEEAEQLARNLDYAISRHYNPPRNFYGVGGMKIFRDLIYEMQGMMKEDHRFYKEHGFYDFPQKKKSRIAAMYLVGTMLNNSKVRKKLGSKMTEGMLLPYKKVLKAVEKHK